MGPCGGSAHVALSSAIAGGGIAGASRSSLVKCSLRAGVWESTSPTARVISVLAYGPTRVALDALSRADEPSASFSPPSDVVPIKTRVWLTKIAPNSRVDASAAKRSGNAETQVFQDTREGVRAPAMSAADDAVSASSPPPVPVTQRRAAHGARRVRSLPDAAAATRRRASSRQQNVLQPKAAHPRDGPPGSAACTIRVNAPLPWCRTCSAVSAAHLISNGSFDAAALDPFFP